MSSNYEKVKEFHEKFKLPVNDKATGELIRFRVNLIVEEFNELVEEMLALAEGDETTRENMAKEMCDLLYVVYGTAVSLGLPIDEIFEEVHQSNMTKLGEDGKPVYNEAGKVIKGPNYKEPDLTRFFGEVPL